MCAHFLKDWKISPIPNPYKLHLFRLSTQGSKIKAAAEKFNEQTYFLKGFHYLVEVSDKPNEAL